MARFIKQECQPGIMAAMLSAKQLEQRVKRALRDTGLTRESVVGVFPERHLGEALCNHFINELKRRLNFRTALLPDAQDEKIRLTHIALPWLMEDELLEFLRQEMLGEEPVKFPGAIVLKPVSGLTIEQGMQLAKAKKIKAGLREYSQEEKHLLAFVNEITGKNLSLKHGLHKIAQSLLR